MKDFVLDEKNKKATWIYEYNMWKNPTIYLTVWKIIILCALVPAFVVFIVTIEASITFALYTFIKVLGIVVGIVSILLFLTYIIVCIINGGKYLIVFEMDNKGIKHIQMNKQFTKAQGVSYIGIVIGSIKGDLVTTGANILSSSKNSVYSEYKKVKQIESIKKRNTIKIKTTDGYNNQIYVNDKFYDTILEMIINKCPKSVVLKKGEKNNES